MRWDATYEWFMKVIKNFTQLNARLLSLGDVAINSVHESAGHRFKCSGDAPKASRSKLSGKEIFCHEIKVKYLDSCQKAYLRHPGLKTWAVENFIAILLFCPSLISTLRISAGCPSVALISNTPLFSVICSRISLILFVVKVGTLRFCLVYKTSLFITNMSHQFGTHFRCEILIFWK